METNLRKLLALTFFSVAALQAAEVSVEPESLPETPEQLASDPESKLPVACSAAAKPCNNATCPSGEPATCAFSETLDENFCMCPGQGEVAQNSSEETSMHKPEAKPAKEAGKENESKQPAATVKKSSTNETKDATK